MRGARLGIALLFFAAAPTAGDIGSCGQPPDDLDAWKFFASKGAIDVQKCDECGIVSDVCAERRTGLLEAVAFPDGCYPLVHDGEVCLNALAASGCDEYRAYVADTGREVPTECNFCPPRAAAVAEPDGGPVFDGGAP